MNSLPFCLAILCLAATVRGDKSGLALKVVPSPVVDTVTDELTIDCRPDGTQQGKEMGLVMDIFRHDDSGDTMVAVVRSGMSALVVENRTSAEGHLKSLEKDKKKTYLTASIKQPTFSDEGVYECRYVYMDSKYQVKTRTTSFNLTVIEVPPIADEPEPEEPVVAATGCDCDKVWDEINALKGTIVQENQRLKAEIEKYNETCRVSFSAKFSAISEAIKSEMTLPFDDVISNKGGAFQTDKNAFFAPCTGQYFFSLTLRSQQKMDSGYVDGLILVDGEEVVRTSVFLDMPVNNFQSATNGAVISLTANQEVKVQLKTTSFGSIRGKTYSVLTGFYLFP